eukprot:m.27541 g.27541  ORF g.27541 m.27541 type:complete len:53 (+) comp9368_c0_seq1:614-772(+)
MAAVGSMSAHRCFSEEQEKSYDKTMSIKKQQHRNTWKNTDTRMTQRKVLTDQ